MDASPQDYAELPSPAVMHPKELFLGRSTMRTRLAIAYPFSSLHPSGVGLDFLLQIHDRRSIVLMRGACRDHRVRTPPVFSPKDVAKLPRRARGAGSYFRIFGAGFSGRGAARAAGSSLTNSETDRASAPQKIRGSAIRSSQLAVVSSLIESPVRPQSLPQC